MMVKVLGVGKGPAPSPSPPLQSQCNGNTIATTSAPVVLGGVGAGGGVAIRVAVIVAAAAAVGLPSCLLRLLAAVFFVGGCADDLEVGVLLNLFLGHDLQRALHSQSKSSSIETLIYGSLD
eukprot:13036788-Alexandrium_andersonii.AAC.1